VNQWSFWKVPEARSKYQQFHRPFSTLRNLVISVIHKVFQGGYYLSIYSFESGQSQSYITTDGQSVSMSWCLAQSGTIDQSLLSP
jgi:hypothetical protein